MEQLVKSFSKRNLNSDCSDKFNRKIELRVKTIKCHKDLAATMDQAITKDEVIKCISHLHSGNAFWVGLKIKLMRC